ncbi:appetite-regulating hormone [Ascaphus truei]|uniref:appetite-regulating hormone n=1 Tax=Ascaphus truei TaxID=8439 RepID=UPI003F5916ED
MFARGAVCGVVLLCLLWTEYTEAGSSFLSPADLQKASQKRPPKKVTNNPHRREAADPWDSPEDPLAGDQSEIRFKIPLDMNLKMTAEQFRQQTDAIQKILLGFLSLNPSQDLQDGNE